jgi:hypothetical protein
MNRKSFLRKVIYLAAMAALLAPMAMISMPETSGRPDQAGRPGGKLAQLRVEEGLSSARLGQIDPAGEAIRLATFGMRGLAANILWGQAQHYQMRKDWTNLSTTLEQIIHLQPNFISVWRFQGWNLSYNVSAEFDDYRQRYQRILAGIDFLDEGTRYNRNDVRLLMDIGYVNGHKIGRADESRPYRRMYRHDDDYHARRRNPSAVRDNWLVGRDAYREAEGMVARGEAQVPGNSSLLFYSWAPLFQISYADALETDGGDDGRGRFGEEAQRAWQTAYTRWAEFGQRDIQTTNNDIIRLGDDKDRQQRTLDLFARLESLAPGLRTTIESERREALSADEIALLEKPEKDLSDEERTTANRSRVKLIVTHQDVAQRIEGPNREEATRLSDELTENIRLAYWIGQYRNTVNYPQWESRTVWEQDLQYVRGLPEGAPKVGRTVRARQLIDEAERARFVDADLAKAIQSYNRGMALWREVIDAHPDLLANDELLVDDLLETISRYVQLLELQGEPFPDPFILQPVADQKKKNMEGMMSQMGSAASGPGATTTVPGQGSSTP